MEIPVASCLFVTNAAAMITRNVVSGCPEAEQARSVVRAPDRNSDIPE
jgi:hypothetical protein